LKILRLSEGEVDDSPLIRVHFAEDKRRSGRAYPVGSELGHGPEFRLASRAEAFYITHQPLTLSQLAPKGLV
jgi:hypothetical protein